MGEDESTDEDTSDTDPDEDTNEASISEARLSGFTTTTACSNDVNSDTDLPGLTSAVSFTILLLIIIRVK